MKQIQVVIFRYRYKKLGGHYHVRLFSGQGTASPERPVSEIVGTVVLSKCGDVIFSEDEWDAFRQSIVLSSVTADRSVLPVFVPEDGYDGEGNLIEHVGA